MYCLVPKEWLQRDGSKKWLQGGSKRIQHTNGSKQIQYSIQRGASPTRSHWIRGRGQALHAQGRTVIPQVFDKQSRDFIERIRHPLCQESLYAVHPSQNASVRICICIYSEVPLLGGTKKISSGPRMFSRNLSESLGMSRTICF